MKDFAERGSIKLAGCGDPDRAVRSDDMPMVELRQRFKGAFAEDAKDVELKPPDKSVRGKARTPRGLEGIADCLDGAALGNA